MDSKLKLIRGSSDDLFLVTLQPNSSSKMSKSIGFLAFETLYSKLTHEPAISLTLYLKAFGETLDELPPKTPLFITWNKHDNLRGCIGTFQDLPIESGVKRFSLTAALDDSRFPPIRKSELPLLDVHVTLLANFTPISAWDDWKIGKHGLKIHIVFQGASYSGTFLPSVAEEQQWDQETTVYYLLQKADLMGVKKASTVDFVTKGIKEGWIELVRYDGLKWSLSYDDFIKGHQLVQS